MPKDPKDFDAVDKSNVIKNLTPELKPCPFCGGENIFEGTSPFADFMRCADCGAQGPDATTPENMERIREQWNTRFEGVILDFSGYEDGE